MPPNSLYARMGTEGTMETTEQRPSAPSIIPGVERTLVAHPHAMTRNRLYTAAMQWIHAQPAIAVDVETTGLRHWSGNDRVVGIAVYGGGTSVKRSFYFPFRHGRGENLNLDPSLIRTDFGPLLARTDQKKINFNCKFDQEALYQDTGTIWGGKVYDSAISAHMLEENETNRTLKGLSDKYLDAGASQAEEDLQRYMSDLLGITTRNKAFLWYLPPDQVSDYACADVELAWALLFFHLPFLAKYNLRGIFEEVSQYAQIITEMECLGALIDLDTLHNRLGEARTEYNECLQQLRDMLRRPDFNPNSSPQCGSAFGLINGKNGKISAAKGIIEARLAKGPWVLAEEAKLLIRTRQWSRAIGLYYEKYLELMEPRPFDRGRHVLHCNFRLAQVRTPRLSCAEPNLQAVPRQSDIYRVKDVFAARYGYVLLEADYSQAELRQLAAEAKIERMCQILNDGGDLHGETSAEMTRLTGRTVDRDYAKRMNFGAVYGLGGEGLSDYLHITEAEGAEYMRLWHEVWPEVRRYSNELTSKAYNDGTLELWTGRIKHYTGSCDCGKRGCLEWHKAMSHRIQGGVGEMIRVAMMELDRVIKASRPTDPLYGTRMLLQVHDSVLFEVPAGRMANEETRLATCRAIQRIMERGPDDVLYREWTKIPQYSCPPRVDMKYGDLWGNTAHIELDPEDDRAEQNNPVSQGHTNWTSPGRILA